MFKQVKEWCSDALMMLFEGMVWLCVMLGATIWFVVAVPTTIVVCVVYVVIRGVWRIILSVSNILDKE